MRGNRGRLVLFILAAGLVALPFLSSLERALSAPTGCSVSGEAYGAYAYVGGTINLSKVARVVLPPGGADFVASVFAIPLVTTGAVTDAISDNSTATSAIANASSTLNAINVLGGVITATTVRSEATSISDGITATSSAAGTSFQDLAISGVAQTNL